MNQLDGKKTYVCMTVVALAGAAMGLGWISKDQFEAIAGIAGSLGAMALRAGVKKSGPVGCSPVTGADYDIEPPK